MKQLNLTLVITGLCLLLMACDNQVKSAAMATKPEKVALCTQANNIYLKQHPQFAAFQLKHTVFNAASNGNAAVQLYLKATGPLEFSRLAAVHDTLKIECSFLNDYEYRFKASVMSKV